MNWGRLRLVLQAIRAKTRFGEHFAILFQSSALTVRRSSVEFWHRFKEIDSTTN